LQDGADIPSQTLHSLLYQLETGKTTLSRNSVLVIDESGMVGSRQLARVLEQVESAGAKAVLVGDSRQLQPIDAGGGFRYLSAELGHATLQEIRRQKDDWAREAVHDFAEGRAGRAVDAYVARGLVTTTTTRDEATQAIVTHWKQDRELYPQDSQILLAGTRAEVAAINAQVRSHLKEAGQLAETTVTLTARGEREIGQGERVVFLQNNTAMDVRNGSLGTVTTIEHTVDGVCLNILTDRGHTVSVNPRFYSELDHGYAMTIHKAQGVTVDRAYILAGPMHDRELSYVSMSRTREPTRLYITAGDLATDQAIVKTTRRMNQSHQKTTTLDYPARAKPGPDRDVGR
jgi:Ti-type conjugative transfer relaxase TraA